MTLANYTNLATAFYNVPFVSQTNIQPVPYLSRPIYNEKIVFSNEYQDELTKNLPSYNDELSRNDNPNNSPYGAYYKQYTTNPPKFYSSQQTNTAQNQKGKIFRNNFSTSPPNNQNNEPKIFKLDDSKIVPPNQKVNFYSSFRSGNQPKLPSSTKFPSQVSVTNPNRLHEINNEAYSEESQIRLLEINPLDVHEKNKVNQQQQFQRYFPENKFKIKETNSEKENQPRAQRDELNYVNNKVNSPKENKLHQNVHDGLQEISSSKNLNINKEENQPLKKELTLRQINSRENLFREEIQPRVQFQQQKFQINNQENQPKVKEITNKNAPKIFVDNSTFPTRPLQYKRIETVKQTEIHPVIDYDEEYEYYDDADGTTLHVGGGKAFVSHVTPIEGPIVLKNGTVPVVPLYSYPLIKNGTYVQIPIFWTALSIAFGLELQGELIKGVPCIKKYYQLYCPTAGDKYPVDKIDLFIDENKALIRRMYGEFTSPMPQTGNPSNIQRNPIRKRETDKIIPGVSDLYSQPIDYEQGASYFKKFRKNRQASTPPNPPNLSQNSGESGRVDACESKVEIVTPYWASNANGKVRAIVNTQHFEQAIHQEVCSKSKTKRCSNDCGCEQKYKWHRLLAYDPDEDCKGIFMDWFLFPSCCVCRCDPKKP